MNVTCISCLTSWYQLTIAISVVLLKTIFRFKVLKDKQFGSINKNIGIFSGICCLHMPKSCSHKARSTHRSGVKSLTVVARFRRYKPRFFSFITNRN